jgi:hypothetical protein
MFLRCECSLLLPRGFTYCRAMKTSKSLKQTMTPKFVFLNCNFENFQINQGFDLNPLLRIFSSVRVNKIEIGPHIVEDTCA